MTFRSYQPAQAPIVDTTSRVEMGLLRLKPTTIEENQTPNPGFTPAVVSLPKFSDPQYRFELLQQWEGVVREAGDEEFIAVLEDLTMPGAPTEEAALSLDEVPPADLALVEPGAVFYWSIGYRTNATGEKLRVSQLRFRRLPHLTRSERKQMIRDAAAFKDLLSPHGYGQAG